MTRADFGDRATSPVHRALQKALALLRGEHGVERDEAAPGSVARIITFVDSTTFLEEFARLPPTPAAVLGVRIGRPGPAPWDGMKPDFVEAFENTCTISSLSLPTIIEGLLRRSKQEPRAVNPPDWQRTIASNVAAAHNLHRLLRRHSHGRGNDLANAFLGPLRMLLRDTSWRGPLPEAWWARASRACREFEENVVSEVRQRGRLNSPHGLLGTRLVDTWDRIQELCPWNGCPEVIHRVSARRLELANLLERIMGIFTECRTGAGQNEPDGTAPVVADDPGDLSLPIAEEGRDRNELKYRVLVIEDHASSWRPVLQRIQQRLLESGKPTAFDFSVDGRIVVTGPPEQRRKQEVTEAVGSYDAVLLDVFLPSTSGAEVLVELKDAFRDLPVVLWTTCTAVDLSRRVSARCDGFLLKKRNTIEEIESTLSQAIVKGRTRRERHLINAFFASHIDHDGLRPWAGEFTKWCLKFVDSFHALDSTYFRFFNDHGGRHLVALLSILERLLEPILLNGAIVSRDAEERKRELFCLYVGVLCHELGMFPMRRPPENGRSIYRVEPFEAFSRDELNLVRSQHAVRGLLLLKDARWQLGDLHRYLQQLGELAPESVRTAICLLVGFHSRFLSLSDFCALSESNLGALRRAEREYPSLAVPEGEVCAALSSLRREWERLDPGAALRLRRLCALLRFADGIDVDHTRVPAEFILHGEGRSFAQDVEDLKRLVVQPWGEGGIQNGWVTLTFNAPDPERFRDQLAGFPDGFDLKDVFGFTNRRDGSQLARTLKKHFEGALWSHLKSRPPRSPPITSGYAQLLAALTVCAEVADEYGGIMETGLDRFIRLRNPKWADAPSTPELLLRLDLGCFKSSEPEDEGV